MFPMRRGNTRVMRCFLILPFVRGFMCRFVWVCMCLPAFDCLDVRCWCLVVRCWCLNVRCWYFDVQFWYFDVRCWCLDVQFWYLDVRRWYFDVRCWYLDVRCWCLKVRFLCWEEVCVMIRSFHCIVICVIASWYNCKWILWGCKMLILELKYK